MQLPTKPTEPKCSLQDLSMLIYGQSGIGKSTFASQAPNAFFIQTEPGLNALRVLEEKATNWEDFCEICRLVAEGKHDYKTIVIDTIDMMYRLCADHICKKNGVTHEGEGAHGKLYGLIKIELLRVLTKLAHLPYGLILISHSVDKEKATRTGTTTFTQPTVPESFRQIVIGLVDIILYCDVEPVLDKDGKQTSRRVMRSSPHADYDAKDRFGCLPEIAPLDFKTFADTMAKAGEAQDTTKTAPKQTTKKAG